METEKKFFSDNLEENLKKLKDSFSYPTNEDFVVRSVHIPSLKKAAALLYVKGAVDVKRIEENILTPLFEKDVQKMGESFDRVKELLTVQDLKSSENFSEVVHLILSGHTAIMIEGSKEVILAVTPKFAQRSVEQPEIESVIKGPKEAFIESLEVNRSLIRKALKSHHLITEKLLFGKEKRNEVSLMYMGDIVNQELLTKVRERVLEIEAEHIQNLSILEQHIEERPYSLVPTVLLTERPDRAVSFLKEGHIVLLMESSPDCLIVPVTFWSFFHTAEDQYQRWAFGNLMRIVRLLAFFAALLGPAAYIAITNYHIEVIPTNLLLTVAATRETVPFPGLFELIMIEITFDIIRESGLRLPIKMGPVVSLLSAVIISYAAIEAGIVSPVLIAIVGFSSLASFSIPSNSFNFAVRLARFGFIGLSAMMGFFGIAIGVQMSVAYLATVKSFDVPFVSPMAPHYPSSKDMIVRPPVWKQWLRPLNLYPQNRVRGKKPKGGKLS
ncbi:spore germination protein [Bacillus sp. DJP31]|uniref:spore germination protein n=1 Tax=Bacillus sp. DJP31 TaxID=3409789 RepID=UPI003BB618D0